MRRKLPNAEALMTEAALESIIGSHHTNALKRVQAGGTLSDAELRYYKRLLAERQKATQLKQIRASDVMGPEEARWTTRVRRRRVFEMSLKNYTVREMVEALPASMATVIDDLKAIKGELNASIDLTQATRILNEKMAEFQAIKSMAAMTLEEVEPGERAQLLSVIRATTEAEIELMQDAGVLSKAALKTEIVDPHGKLQATAPIIEVMISEPSDDDVPPDKIVYLPGQEPQKVTHVRKKKRGRG